MKKKCVHLLSGPDGRVEIYCLERIAGDVLSVWHEKGHIKKTRRIIDLMFKGEFDQDLYSYYSSYGVSAMK